MHTSINKSTNSEYQQQQEVFQTIPWKCNVVVFISIRWSILAFGDSAIVSSGCIWKKILWFYVLICIHCYLVNGCSYFQMTLGNSVTIYWQYLYLLHVGRRHIFFINLMSSSNSHSTKHILTYFQYPFPMPHSNSLSSLLYESIITIDNMWFDWHSIHECVLGSSNIENWVYCVHLLSM